MGEVYTYNATHLTLVRDGEVELTQSAELGAVATGRLTLRDEAGTLSIVGQKDFSVTQSACSFTRTFRGFISDRTYSRGEADPKVGASRDIAVTVQDLNAMLGFRLIHQATGLSLAEGGYRPSETVSARMTWLLASPFVSGLFTGSSRVAASTFVMDKADYRNQYPGDVLADMALAAAFNYHINDWGSGPELTFRDDNTSTADSSTLRISNVLSDASAVTLHPFKDATLERSPSNVHSLHGDSYAKGTVYEERAATATAFNGERGGTSSNANIKTATQAHEHALFELAQHSTEEDVITCTVLVTDAQVNLILPGQRIQAKFSHLATEGYGSFTWFRVLERTVRPIVPEGTLYELPLKLSPQEAAPVADTCVDLYDPTPSGTYYPLGSPTGISPSNPSGSDAIIYYFRPGLADPITPNASYVGQWHFGVFGAGGAGTIDYAGDCVQNWLIFMTVGNGTWTIQTERWAGVARALNAFVGPVGFGNGTLAAQFTSGDSVEITIDDTADGDCLRWVAIIDGGGSCGSKWGWSEAEWVAA